MFRTILVHHQEQILYPVYRNIYTFQRDTQCSCTDQVFINTQVSAVHVSDRNDPSSGASL